MKTLFFLFSLNLAFSQSRISIRPNELVTVQYVGCKSSHVNIDLIEIDSFLINSKSIVMIYCQNLDSLFVVEINPSRTSLKAFNAVKSEKEIDSLLKNVCSQLNFHFLIPNVKKGVFILNPNQNHFIHDFNSNLFDVNCYLLTSQSWSSSKLSDPLFGCFLLNSVVLNQNVLLLDLKNIFPLNFYSNWCFDKFYNSKNDFSTFFYIKNN